MARINIRSPYFVNVTDTNLTSAILYVYIYTGTQGGGGGYIPIYTLNSTAYNDEVTFEISELVRDYLDVTFDGNYTSQMVWVDYKVTKSISGTPIAPEDRVELGGFDGYGYFEDGANPQNESALMMSNTMLYSLDGDDCIIPVSNELTDYVEFYDSNTLVDIIRISSSTNVNKQIEYLESSESISDGYENRVLRDGGVIESLDCIDSEFPNISKFDKAIIYNLLGESTTVNVENISECKYTPHKIIFINKFGALQDLWFFKRSNLTINTKKEEYKANIINNGSYSINSHQNRILRKQGTEKLTLNSGFVTEEYNEVFRQLMLSEKVWINYNNKTLPINISSSSLDYKTSLNDRLINYTVQVDFAFDKINSVR